MKFSIIGTVAAAALLASCASTTNSGPQVPGSPIVASATTVGACIIKIAAPPAKPNKGADFAENAVAKNVGRNVGRNLITNIGGRFGGGVGAAVAGGVASNAIRTEQDLKGKWFVTDGRDNCACEVEITTAINLSLEQANNGTMRNVSCTHSLLSQVASWNLGQTFTGYEAPLTLKAADGREVAWMKRDGINYFSGNMGDGKTLTMWRRMGVPQ